MEVSKELETAQSVTFGFGNGFMMTELSIDVTVQSAGVMFSDESTLRLQPDYSLTFIWRMPSTLYPQDNIIDRHRYGGTGLLVWGDLY
ncbi:hypothetical protein TNCV_1233141 [Trichonephila clavipes]|nr:hypothetical protein TNCV_1233141 [Trichonephila clavipes]